MNCITRNQTKTFDKAILLNSHYFILSHTQNIMYFLLPCPTNSSKRKFFNKCNPYL